MRKHPKLVKSSIPFRVVNNGIQVAFGGSGDGELFAKGLDQEILDFCGSGFALGALGRLSPEKGFDLLLRALKVVAVTIPDIRLVIIGEGGERQRLEGLICELGLVGKVLLPGFRPQARDYLMALHALVLSSLSKGLPMVVLEGMQAGVPIVATRVEGLPEVLEDGKAGILVESGSVEALAEGILALAKDEILCRKLAAQARLRVATNYSSRHMAEGYLEIYRSLLPVNLPMVARGDAQ